MQSHAQLKLKHTNKTFIRHRSRKFYCMFKTNISLDLERIKKQNKTSSKLANKKFFVTLLAQR